MGAETTATQTPAEIDATQRKQTDRIRGWFDKQFLFADTTIATSLLTHVVPPEMTSIAKLPDSYQDDPLDGWANLPAANGDNKVVKLSTPPPSYSRTPNQIPTDIAMQASDVIFNRAHKWNTAGNQLQYIEDSLRGKQYPHWELIQNNMTTHPVADRKPRTVVFLVDPKEESVKQDFRTLAESRPGVLVFELDTSVKEDVMKMMKEVLQHSLDGKGVEVVPITLESLPKKQFKSLKKKGGNNKNTSSATSFWSKITKFFGSSSSPVSTPRVVAA
jgi:hypothetical protein